ncbi:MAG: leucyl/phenylalanyl-tRNA--protein transferase [Blastocatellia bacterium]
MRKPSFLSRITTRHVLAAYHQGMFPMADGRDGPINWYIASRRALIPLDEKFRVRRSLQKVLRRGEFRVTIDTAFEEVIRACARHDDKQADGVWLSEEMIALYVALHAEGHTHSVEVWRGDQLAGGLYGVSVGAAFCGESMFSREAYGSQVALVALVERLRARDYMLLDAQIMSPHLSQFGAYDIAHTDYIDLLAQALPLERSFT